MINDSVIKLKIAIVEDLLYQTLKAETIKRMPWLERLFELSYKKCTAYVMETLRFDRRDIKKEKICVSIHHVYLTYPDYI